LSLLSYSIVPTTPATHSNATYINTEVAYEIFAEEDFEVEIANEGGIGRSSL
jgi:hypothetical protein